MPFIFVTVFNKGYIHFRVWHQHDIWHFYLLPIFPLQCAMSRKKKLEPPLNGERIGFFFPSKWCGENWTSTQEGSWSPIPHHEQIAIEKESTIRYHHDFDGLIHSYMWCEKHINFKKNREIKWKSPQFKPIVFYRDISKMTSQRLREHVS